MDYEKELKKALSHINELLEYAEIDNEVRHVWENASAFYIKHLEENSKKNEEQVDS